MPPKKTSISPRRMSLDSLLEATDKIAAELQRRIDQLAEAQRKLGVEGLRNDARGMKQVVVQFPRYHKRYTYNVPAEAEVGDTVKTPTSYSGGPSLAEIVEDGPGHYTGPVKDVLALYKKA